MEPPPRSLSLAIELVALSVWLGAAVLLAAVVAPAAFDVLPSRTMAGDVVGRVLAALLYAGVVISFVVGMIEAVRQSGQRAGFGFLIGVACMAALVIGQKLDR